MGGCCPGSNDADEAKKRFGLVGAICLIALLVGLIVTWRTASDIRKRQAAREERLNSTNHEHLPIHRGDLDRG